LQQTDKVTQEGEGKNWVSNRVANKELLKGKKEKKMKGRKRGYEMNFFTK